MARTTDRRSLIRTGLAAAVLAPLTAPRIALAAEPPLIPIHTDPAQVFRTTVCLRPFRAAGPRIESETVGRKQVIHNYGHGGSGWSLSGARPQKPSGWPCSPRREKSRSSAPARLA
ncbi:MAG: hypothetical protein NVV72_04495 [Asticcacaulis sp.]|nr:hypothetical protein [Asticcacaulis sp.]